MVRGAGFVVADSLRSVQIRPRYLAMDPGGLVYATGVLCQSLDDTGSRMADSKNRYA
jgi:hypothetical protein